MICGDKALDIESFAKSVQLLVPCASGTTASGQTACYAAFQASGRTPSSGQIHILFLNIFATESYPFMTLVSDCLEVATAMITSGSSSHVLEIEGVRSADFPNSGWHLRFGAGGADFNSCLLGAYGLLLASGLLALSQESETQTVCNLLAGIAVSCPDRGRVVDPKVRTLRAMTQTTIEHKRHRRLDLVLAASLMKKLLKASCKKLADGSIETDEVSKEISALIKKYNSGMLHGVGHQLRGRAAFAIRMAMSEEHLPEEVFCQMVASSVDMRFNDMLLEMRPYKGSEKAQLLILKEMLKDDRAENLERQQYPTAGLSGLVGRCNLFVNIMVDLIDHANVMEDQKEQLNKAFEDGRLTARLDKMLAISLPETYVHTKDFGALVKENIPMIQEILLGAPAASPMASVESAQAEADKEAADLRAAEVQRKIWLQNFEHDWAIFEAACLAIGPLVPCSNAL
ncbi:unnamed protein product [Symbiodinium pilosum]|uniref:Uncharacterized protein n=1 Tax=Symbiodinium pilosum TaxID=2952 RepID=A0A812MAE6_SYMPI|nr:unnamed protein product [Symbiodinium pilosum]